MSSFVIFWWPTFFFFISSFSVSLWSLFLVFCFVSIYFNIVWWLTVFLRLFFLFFLNERNIIISTMMMVNSIDKTTTTTTNSSNDDNSFEKKATNKQTNRKIIDRSLFVCVDRYIWVFVVVVVARNANKSGCCYPIKCRSFFFFFWLSFHFLFLFDKSPLHLSKNDE